MLRDESLDGYAILGGYQTCISVQIRRVEFVPDSPNQAPPCDLRIYGPRDLELGPRAVQSLWCGPIRRRDDDGYSSNPL